ncbi:hypothetical protein [Caballeronia sp. AZ10_KS36]|uniref:hypothetical protein n=1 Tax=Caballeronia sp. AZ10_KS36 TaxID=2921757 RepID=UPI0020287F0F|nr:hypothetical protein [Caballeronia sp. AZ10_KS36]
MLNFSQEEWTALCAADERNFVLAVKEDIVKDRPALAEDATLSDRLNAAYEDAKRIGFTDDKYLVAFLYLESVEPNFYKKPAVSAWLNKKGLPPEQRFDMMMDVARTNLREEKELH